MLHSRPGPVGNHKRRHGCGRLNPSRADTPGRDVEPAANLRSAMPEPSQIVSNQTVGGASEPPTLLGRTVWARPAATPTKARGAVSARSTARGMSQPPLQSWSAPMANGPIAAMT